MSVSQVEDFTHPRDKLPNTYTNVAAREIDFVNRFGQNWDAIRDILGIMQPVRKTAGTSLVSYTASVSLESGSISAGKLIPYSKATVVEASKTDVTLGKYAKAVPIEDVTLYGAEVAIQKTDDAFLSELQEVVLTNFYNVLTDDTYAITETVDDFQMAVAIAIGSVKDKFKQMHKNASEVVVFVNTMDAYRYLGAANVTVQSQFGIDYIQNFMGARTLFLSSELEEGTVIATPVDNLVLYYIDPSDSQYAALGLDYTVRGDTNLIGFHANGNYSTAVGESFALMGMSIWAEYADGIAIITVSPSGATGATGNT